MSAGLDDGVPPAAPQTLLRYIDRTQKEDTVTPCRTPRPGAFRAALTVLATLLALSGTNPLAAQRSLEVDSFAVRIDVRPDASIRVTETIRYEFTGSWNGVFREIPVGYRTPYGFDKRMYLDDVEITDGGGTELWYEDSSPRHYRRFKIRVPGAEDAARTVVIAYTVRNGLLFFEEHDELYWNVTGDESDVPIHHASADVRLPPGVTGTRAIAYTGAWGSTAQNAAWRQTEEGFYFSTTTGLGFREGMTIVVGWDPGVVSRPTAMDRLGLFLRANWPLAFPVLALLFMWRLWWRRGRDPARRAIVPRWEPPEGMTPSEMGTLVDNHPGIRDILADLVELAVKGFVKIEEVERYGLAKLIRSVDWQFTLLRGKKEWDDLPRHQRELLEGIFGERGVKGTGKNASDLSGKFYEHIPDIRESIFGRLQEAGFYDRRPDHVRNAWLIGGTLLAFFSIFGSIVMGATTTISPLTIAVAGLLTAAPVVGFGLVMPVRTVRGARALEEVLGFQEFLERVEQDRFRRMITGPEMFERYLPFAMALGVEERWARAFDELGTPPPSWYGSVHGDGFRPSVFVSNMNTFGSVAGSAMQTAPRSSGGSGFSGGGGGGGFSGGGGGGGGTGGW